MASLPYINLPQSQAPGIIDDIGNTLVQAAQRSQQQKQQAVDNLLKQKQMEAQEAQMRAQEARAQAEAARQEHYAIQEQHKYEHQLRTEAAGALKPMNEMFAAGDTAGGMALGKIHGFDLKQTNLTDNPGAAPLAPIPPPQPDLAGADQMDSSNAVTSPDAQQAAGRDQFAQALADHPRLVAEHAGRLAKFEDAKRNPVFGGTGPFGPVEFNPGAVRAQKEQQQEQQATTMAQGLPPKYGLMLAAKIRGNVPPAEASRQVEEIRRTDEDRALRQQHEDQQLNRDQRFQAALIAGQGRGMGARITAGAADERQALTQYHQDIATDAKVIEKEYRTPYVEAKKAIEYVDSDPNNPEAWIGGRDMLAKAFSGGKVTKAQYDLAAGHSAPGVDKLNQILEGWTTGLPSETQRKNLRAALSNLAGIEAKALRAKAPEFEENYGKDPLVATNKHAAGTYKRHASRLFGDVPKEEAKPGDSAKLSLAREALADPTAPESVKARARQILGQ